MTFDSAMCRPVVDACLRRHDKTYGLVWRESLASGLPQPEHIRLASNLTYEESMIAPRPILPVLGVPHPLEQLNLAGVVDIVISGADQIVLDFRPASLLA